MSEALGEARIIIRPDTTLFRTQLETQLSDLRKPVVIPVTTAATGTGRAASAQVNAQVAATDRLTSAQRLQAQAAEQVAAAQRANILATQGVITQQDRAALATKAAGTADRNLQAALLTEDEALIGAAAATANLAREQAVLAGKAASAARSQQQLGRGFASTTLSQVGLRGATLAASASFIAAAAAATLLSRTLRTSVDAAENLRIQQERLRDTTNELTATNVTRWAGGLATSFGLARDEAVGFDATLQGLFRNFGITGDRATQMSERLVTLAADMAIFKGQGTTTTEALTALQRGLAGNGRALRTFNVFVDQSRVAQEALAETGKKQTSELTRQELILARYNLILQDTANQQGAFAARSETAAAQSRILGANLRNLAAGIGGVVVPQLELATADVNLLFSAFSKLGKIPGVTSGGGGGVGGFLKNLALDALTPRLALQAIHDVLATLPGVTNKAAQSTRGLSGGFGEEAAAARGAENAIVKVTTALHGLNAAQIQGQLQQQQTAVSRAQAFGGTGLPELEAELARIDKVIAKAQRTGTKGPALQSLFDQRKQVIDEIASIEQGFASDAKKAADAAKSARDAADQALLDLFSLQQTKITDALISAGPKAAIALTIRLRNLFRRQREEARKQIKDLKTRRDTLAADTTEIKTLNKQIRDLQKAQREAIAQQAQDARDARLTHLEALLSIAETTTRTSDDKRAIEAIIKFDNARIKALQGMKKRTRQENAELDALRVDLAQREQALRALTTQQKKNQTAAAEFNFLQTQTGFVQNLLGNLIPGGATGGLVGGRGSPSTPENVRPGDALSTAQRTSQANLVRGVTSGQAETQTSVLRAILAEIHRLNQRRDHPEAHHQRRVGSAIMDHGDASGAQGM